MNVRWCKKAHITLLGRSCLLTIAYSVTEKNVIYIPQLGILLAACNRISEWLKQWRYLSVSHKQRTRKGAKVKEITKELCPLSSFHLHWCAGLVSAGGRVGGWEGACIHFARITRALSEGLFRLLLKSQWPELSSVQPMLQGQLGKWEDFLASLVEANRGEEGWHGCWHFSSTCVTNVVTVKKDFVSDY